MLLFCCAQPARIGLAPIHRRSVLPRSLCAPSYTRSSGHCCRMKRSKPQKVCYRYYMRRAWRSLLYIFSLRSNVNISTPGADQSSVHPFLEESMKKLYRFYTLCLLLLLCVSLFCVQAFAVEDMWDGGKPHHCGRLQQDRRHQHGAGRPNVRRRGRRREALQ